MENLLTEKINKAKSIAITGHIRPDGDCSGSVLALYNYIKDNYKDKLVKAYLEIPASKFSYMKGYNDIDDSLVELSEDESSKKSPEYDLCVCLDAADDKRLGGNIGLVKRAEESLTIDHHISHKKYTKDLALDAHASSTCEVMARFLDLSKVGKECASCLYTGLVHDTGVFKYPCTSLETMDLAGKLMEKGVEFSKIIDESFFARDFKTAKVLAKALDDAKLLLENKLILSYTKKETMEKYEVSPKDLDGIIDELRNTSGVEVAIYLYQTSENEYKASLRSKNHVDVSRICVDLGGGGHIRAAGCGLKGSLEEIQAILIAKVEEQL